MSNFKIGDIIKPKDDRACKLFLSLTGKIIDFLGTPEEQFPIIENDEGYLLTVDPSSYELSETK